MLGCKSQSPDKKDVITSIGNDIQIKEFVISPIYYIDNIGLLTLSGHGFKSSDSIVLRNKSIAVDIKCEITKLNPSNIVISLSPSLTDGKYEIFVKRDNFSKLLGETNILKAFNANISDKTGMTIKGTVFSNSKGLANVVVSDGESVTKTDENGIYHLPSKKTNGYVFISIPSNYEVKTVNSTPQFFKYVTFNQQTSEIIDFELTPINNNDHVIAFLADMHLANRNNDISQFNNGFKVDINNLAKEARAQNKKFYAMTLGDQTWDIYWYENNYGLQEFKNQIKDFDFPIFHVMGNHDNDPYSSNDFLAEDKYRNTLGPTYYSFNIGKVHYIVLDNNLWLNADANNGVIGDRNYKATITQNQINWLKQDLAMINDKSTPIVVAMHIPFYSTPNTENSFSTKLTNATEFVGALADFSNVKIMSGHTHINSTAVQENTKISEYNIASVSATWWWTGKDGYSNNHICKDGSPGGYGLLENDGTQQKLYYKSIGYPKEYQFRAYDLNTIHITAEKYAINANSSFKAKVAEYAGEYAKSNTSNEILLNIWGYSPKWKIYVRENNKDLIVRRVTKYDPLHIISYPMKRLNANANPTSSFVSYNTSHMFLTKASSPTSTIEITIEDEFGNIYRETMIRPKAFSTSMK
ncbi:calcineurin-like phosphoesterase C-terminal domain-containing protein [Sphingobacterium sp. WQ 366]|uniref:Calcineurin-like phosphoesterase C-terminal domain-containing protein n=1 Tax=Sphingobacterium bovistauri TaxID=2781959 RepID=A0ABS7Z767_9SPHI|nr:calcineurin-like phosphoesterase C-terminal domain-containing protein [Sphingobacterium bovistauri]